MNVTLSPNVAEISGTVVNTRQEAATGVQVILIPDRRRDTIDRYRTAITDSAGRFTFNGLAPEDYKVFCWEWIEPFSYHVPEILAAFEQQGTAVRVSEGSTATVEVRMIPAE